MKNFFKVILVLIILNFKFHYLINYYLDKECQICGLISYYYIRWIYGGNLCEDCRIFFKKSTKNEKYKEFICNQNEQCSISYLRKEEKCKYCRYQKCIKLGINSKI